MKPGTQVYVSNESKEAALRDKRWAIYLEKSRGKWYRVYQFSGIVLVEHAVPIPIDEEAERVKFEACFPYDIRRCLDGDYTDRGTQMAWNGWLAAMVVQPAIKGT